MKKIILQKKGFSLAEILIALAIFSIVGVIALSIITTAFKQTIKAELAKSARQEGIYALSVIEQNIKNSKEVFFPSPCATEPSTTDTTTIELVQDDITTVVIYRRVNDVAEGVNRVQETLEEKGGGSVLAARFLTSNKFNITNLAFKCSSQQNAVKKIAVDVTIEQRNSALTRREETISLPLTTTVYTRNYPNF